MIISASRRTDIPAFYGEWFLNRLRVGYCRTVNPFNPAQTSTISLQAEDVDGFVFWTKNIGPFLDALAEVHRRQVPFSLSCTVNAYPRALESRVVDPGRSIEQLKAVADRYGPRVVVWRYDPIILTPLTDADHHRRAFEWLCGRLTGVTDEVVVSFVQRYRKTVRNLAAAGLDGPDPEAAEKKRLLADLAALAAAQRMKLSLCTQPELLDSGASEARCIDARRLMEIAGKTFSSRTKPSRAGCGCFESKDIGGYDTCPHGCVYCYAVRDRHLALRRYREHDPQGEFLFPPKSGLSSLER